MTKKKTAGARKPHPVAPQALTVVSMDITAVVPYARNPRTQQQIATVAGSLREFGWQQPIVVDETLTVIAGHTRLEAARSLGMTTVPVHIAQGLTPAQVKAYRLADNRTAQAEWDTDRLTLELLDLRALDFDLALTGFAHGELTALLAAPSGVLLGVDLDDVPELPKAPITKPGDLITLGRHRLVCGDAQDPAVWAQLLPAGTWADACWTDPPYNVAYRGDATNLRKAIANDDLPDADFRQLLRTVFDHVVRRVAPGGAVYVAAPTGPSFLDFGIVLRELGLWRQTLVWVKNTFVLGRSDYHYRHEVIFEGNRPMTDTFEAEDAVLIAYGWQPDAPHRWVGGRSRHTVFEVPKPQASKEHPTMKPVQLIREMLEASVRPGQTVVDPFVGSGSTLMACEVLGVRAALIELDPAYCDVIVTRFENATGQTAGRP